MTNDQQYVVVTLAIVYAFIGLAAYFINPWFLIFALFVNINTDDETN